MIRSNTTRQHALSTLLTVAMAVLALPALAKPMPGHAGLPGTQAGRRAKAFFMAFSSGNDETMRSFESQHRAKSVLERRSIDEGIEQYHELRADWGDLGLDGVFDSKELELSIGVNVGKTDDFLTFRFELEPEAPHGLVAIYIESGGPRPIRVRQSGPLTDSILRNTVKDLASILDRSYVFSEVGMKMAKMLRENLAAGKYERTTSGSALAMRLSSDLADICHDKHLRVVAGVFSEDEHEHGHDDESWSRPSVPGRRYGTNKPVYVLTSDHTFSAAEEFTYNLKYLERATIVGETTGGGAHPVDRHRINDSFAVTVPFARAINPITKTNWERVGVKPQVIVPASQALLAVHKAALERILNAGLDGEPA